MRSFLVALLLLVGAGLTARADDPTKVVTKVAFGSCADQDKPLPAFDTIAAAKPDLFLFLGDTMYADLDKKVKVTPAVIREKYAQLGQVPGFAKLKAVCPRMLGTWDDHDYGKNDAGAEWEHKDEAQQALLDFYGVPKGDPRRARKGVYHAEVFGPPGKRVQVILLDTRYHRSPVKKGPFDPRTRIAPCLPNTDPDATFLGEGQWKWLEEQLKKPAELRLLASSIQVVSDEHPFEKWANIPRERDRLYALLKSTGATGVIVLSGDRHLGEVSLDATSAGFPLYDVTSSGINQGVKTWRPPEKNAKRVAAVPYGDNWGLVSIDWKDADPQVHVQLRDEAGDATAGFKVRLSTLKADAGGVVAAAQPKLPAGVLTPAQAAAKVGEKVMVQFAVASTGGNTVLYLNSNVNFKAAGNFAVMLGAKGWAGKWANAEGDTFKGKTIRATGTVKLYNGAPQLEVTDPKDLEIVDE